MNPSEKPDAVQGVAWTDTPFARYACAAPPSGTVIEVVEPLPDAQQVRGRLVRDGPGCRRRDHDVAAARRLMRPA